MSAATSTTTTEHSTHDELLVEAIAVLTKAARRTQVVLDRDGGRRELPADWAEFVALALAGAAANVGGVETALAGRSGSWEADFTRQLLTGTVGHAGEYLWEHRTEPFAITLYVDEILTDVGGWKPYEDADQELDGRLAGLPSAPSWEAAQKLPPLTDEQEQLIDEVEGLRDRLEAQRLTDWAAYGEALKAAVLAAVPGRLPGLTVPVEVTVDLETFRAKRYEPYWPDLEWELVGEVIAATPVPPRDGCPPLDRLQQPIDGEETTRA